MKVIMNLFAFFLAIILLANCVNAHEIPAYQDKYVNDFAGVLSSEQAGSLRDLFIGVDKNTTAEVVFVSAESAGEHTPQQYATEVLNEWKVGKSDKDNGLVLFYAKKENKFWIATGYGLEGILPDSKIGRLLDENYVPLRDEGKVSEGIIAFSQVAMKVIVDNKDEVISGKAGGSTSYLTSFIIFLFFIVLAIIIFSKFIASKKKVNSTINESGISISASQKTTDSNKKYINILSTFIFLFFFYSFFVDSLILVGIAFFLMIISNSLFNLIPKKCSKDGKRLNFFKKDGKNKYYKCSHGHILTISLAAVAASGAFAGSSFGGSSGSSFGGGGFGGGGGGGGGAGR